MSSLNRRDVVLLLEAFQSIPKKMKDALGRHACHGDWARAAQNQASLQAPDRDLSEAKFKMFLSESAAGLWLHVRRTDTQLDSVINQDVLLLSALDWYLRFPESVDDEQRIALTREHARLVQQGLYESVGATLLYYFAGYPIETGRWLHAYGHFVG